MDNKPNQIFKMSIHKIFQLFKYMIPAYSLDLEKVTTYAGITYFKQLEGFASGTYATAYSKYANTVVIIVYFN